MNHLAHLFLSCNCPDRLVGNFIADALHIKEVEHLPERIKEGVRLHHAIDAFTDSHPEVHATRDIIRNRFRKYTPVVLDVYFDYLLATCWSTFSNEPLSIFSQRVYGILLDRLDWHPEPLRKHLPEMISKDWLSGYATEYGIRKSFASLSRRASKSAWLEGATEYLLDNQETLKPYFLRFFPDLVTHVEKACSQ